MVVVVVVVVVVIVVVVAVVAVVVVVVIVVVVVVVYFSRDTHEQREATFQLQSLALVLLTVFHPFVFVGTPQPVQLYPCVARLSGGRRWIL